MGAWRPIESAPKDGTRFDVWYAHHDAMVPTPAHRLTDVYWSDVESAFCTDGLYGPEEPSPLPLYPCPTHWQPLPPPPGSDPDPCACQDPSSEPPVCDCPKGERG